MLENNCLEVIVHLCIVVFYGLIIEKQLTGKSLLHSTIFTDACLIYHGDAVQVLCKQTMKYLTLTL